MGVNSLPNTVTRQRRGCNLNPGPFAPESSTLTSRLPSHPEKGPLNMCGPPLVHIANGVLISFVVLAEHMLVTNRRTHRPCHSGEEPGLLKGGVVSPAGVGR